MNRGRARWFLRQIVVAVVATTAVHAMGQSTVRPAPVVAPEEGPRWSALSAAERSALAPLQAEWPRIDADRKQKWVEVAQRFPALSSAERTRIQARMTEWVKMSPAERGRARLQFQETRQFTPEDRQARWEAYKALPASERNALAAKAAPGNNASRTAAPPRPAAASTGSDKRNVVTAPPARPATKTVAPTVVQAAPGATTTLVSKPAAPPVHHQPGMPKIAATKGFVDPATLLPTRGPQGAAIAATGPASAAAEHP